MEQDKETSSNEDNASFEEEISKLIQEQLLFTESIYNRLPISIEVYDANGVLRSINNHALHMYGVEDRNTVVNFFNLFKWNRKEFFSMIYFINLIISKCVM